MVEYYNNDDLKRIYDAEYFSVRYESQPKNWYVKAEFIKRVIAPKRVLDIGCAEGRLVEELYKLGIDIYGIDGSSYALSQGNPVIKDKLFRVNQNSDKFPFKDEYFDGGSCLHTIE